MSTMDKYNLNMAEFFNNLSDKDFLRSDAERGFSGERSEEDPKAGANRKSIEKEHKKFLDAVGEFIRSIDIKSL